MNTLSTPTPPATDVLEYRLTAIDRIDVLEALARIVGVLSTGPSGADAVLVRPDVRAVWVNVVVVSWLSPVCRRAEFMVDGPSRVMPSPAGTYLW